MDGLHQHLRDGSNQHLYVFGEARGGSFVTGTTTSGNATFDNAIKIQQFSAETPGVTKWGGSYGRIFNET